MSAAVHNEPPAAAVAADAHWSAKMGRLRARKAAEVPLYLWQDPEIRDAFEAARRDAHNARQLAESDPANKTLKQEAEEAAAALKEARAAYEADCEVLMFRALPGDAFSDLVKEHPPTEEQAEGGSDWNEDTFPAALIAAANVDGMTEDDAADLLATWGMADRVDLFQAALAAQNTKRSDWGKGSGPTRS
ncbi:hypothetical protein [Streptomyces sp. AC1-42T]|uniref:hypothetical protein n=1 Tax=Streptomyces sp. AC1-42T TaxID=2218665 RepID=UPI000DABF4B1|nr:hypothetical protein [Streptomyces sp. AC1-42T]PZT71502.1 hypothetical protein DNK55_32850 [Streptomyces sp. AC1-42T]